MYEKGNKFTSAYTFVHIRVKSNRVVCATLRLKSCIIRVYEGCSFNTRGDCYIVNSVVVHKTTFFSRNMVNNVCFRPRHWHCHIRPYIIIKNWHLFDIVQTNRNHFPLNQRRLTVWHSQSCETLMEMVCRCICVCSDVAVIHSYVEQFNTF